MKQHTKPSIPGSATVTDAMGTVTATTPANSIEGTTSDQASDIAPGVISDANGYLMRNRPPQRWMDWSKVPVGRNASLQTSHGLSTRDLEIMRFAERFGMVTIEQITRVFFNSEDPAYNAVMQLRKRRYLAKVELPSTFLTEAVGRRPSIANSAYVLDWNGFYYLRFHADEAQHLARDADTDLEAGRGGITGADNRPSNQAGIAYGSKVNKADSMTEGSHSAYGHAISRWNPASVAPVNTRLGHTLGVSEVWSYIMAAARAAYERPAPQHPEDPIKYRLKAFLLNERESCIPSSLSMLSKDIAPKNTGKFLALPDATVVLSFQISLSPLPVHTALPVSSLEPSRPALPNPPTPIEGISYSTLTGVAGPSNRNPAPHLWSPPSRSEAREVAGIHKGTNQYDPIHSSWQHAFLPLVPFPARGQLGDPPSPFSTRYRFIFLEMETGSNNRHDLQAKIERYNRVYRKPDIWKYIYGHEHFPRVLVVVRAKEQVERTTIMWRDQFAHRAHTAVLVTSLQHLADAYLFGRRGLIELPCWLDVFGDPTPRWCTLDDALGIDLVVARAEAARAARLATKG